MKKLIVTLLAGANVCTILILWAVCFSSWLSPTLYPRLAQAGLLMPIALGTNLAFVFLWFVIDIKGILLPLVGILPVYSICLDYCPLNFSRDDTPDSTQTLRVASFNCGNWAVKDSTDGKWNTPQLLQELNADILCLQEQGSINGEAGTTLKDMGYEWISNSNVAICSKLPFIGDSIPTGNTGHSIIACKVKNGEDTLLVVSVHLESSHIPVEERIALGEHIQTHNRDEIKKSGRVILGFLSTSAVTRAGQVNKLDSLLTAHKGESIVLCGDFNDTPVSNAYRKMNRHLKNCFRESGRGLGLTYSRPGFWVRIDHIFVSDDWESCRTRVVRKYPSSDHFPIVTTLSRKSISAL